MEKSNSSICKFDKYFEPQIMERGIGYYFNDLVKDFKCDNHQYTAKIDGTRIYSVWLKLNDKEDKIEEAHCNCPYSVDREKYCKHIYALLYAAKGDKIDNRPTKKPVKYTPPTGEIVNIKCPNCGSNLRVDSPTETIECKYCHSILNQAEKYYKLEDFREAYFEFAKAHDLDKDNKCIEYYMNLSAKRKNIETNLSLNDYSYIYDLLKEAFKEEKDDEKQEDLLQSFINLLTVHANKHLNRFDLSGKFFWLELDRIIDYYIKILKEIDLSDNLIGLVYKNYKDALKIEIENYDTFKNYATNSKEALQKASQRIEREILKYKK